MTRWRWAALAAVATILTGLSFGLVPASDGCRAVAAHPWADFQQIGSVEAARKLIGACGADRLRRGMWIDALAFIPAYSAFLLAVLWAARPSQNIAQWVLVLLAVGVIADQVEGFRLLALIDADGGTSAMVAVANRATIAKEMFLALATGTVGWALSGHRDWRRVAGLAAATAAAIAAAAALMHVPSAMFMLLAWLILATVALVGAVRPAGRDTG
jgi:hypothetical protein